MPAGRPKGTKDPNARSASVRIPLTVAEKAALENTARMIAAQRGEPELGVATVLREFLLTEMLRHLELNTDARGVQVVHLSIKDEGELL